MIKKKNIVILTAVHPYKASGIVAYDLMLALKQTGANIILITNERLEKKYENTISVRTRIDNVKERIILKISKIFLRKIPIDSKYYMYGLNDKFTDRNARKILKILPFEPDFFIYLFPQYFLSVRDLFYLNKKTKAPILWYMMDMAPLTGGCNYAYKCIGYTMECGKCPGIFSNDEKDQTYKNFIKKKKLIDQTNILPIAGSEWQFEQLKKSSLFQNKPIYKNLIPISNNIFKPGNKDEARKQLGIPNSKKIIFIAAVSIKEIRKGYMELSESLFILNTILTPIIKESLHIVIAGQSDIELESNVPFNHSYLGYLNYSHLALAFQAADIFVCPSIEDSGPMMINQSILCATPVVSFAMGVSIDLVITGETGYRAKLADSNDLAHGIKRILELNDDQYKKMRENCRVLSQNYYHTQNYGERFIGIFNANS